MTLNDPKIVLGLFTAIAALLVYLHRDGVAVLKEIKRGQDGLRDDINALTSSTKVHNVKLEQGAKEFAKIEEHQRHQDEKIDALKDSIHDVKNKMVTLEMLKEFH